MAESFDFNAPIDKNADVEMNRGGPTITTTTVAEEPIMAMSDNNKDNNIHGNHTPSSMALNNDIDSIPMNMSDKIMDDSGICNVSSTTPSSLASSDVMTLATKDAQTQNDNSSQLDEPKQNVYPESPKSRNVFARPKALFNRKRTFGGSDSTPKLSGPNFVDDAPSSAKISKPTDSSFIHRTLSTSVLERGEIYSQNNAGSPHLVGVQYSLKTLSPTCSNAYRRIEASTLLDLLLNSKDEPFSDKFILVDCRYPYEYEGGHIKHAINLFDPAECEGMFYNSDGSKKFERIPIFYCEYSQKRGPSMACALRQVDRRRNSLNWPNCDYHEMYVLDKGFRNFYLSTRDEQHMTMCQPNNYITMDDPKFTAELKKWPFHKKSSGSKSVKVVRSRRSLTRNQTIDSPHIFGTSFEKETSSHCLSFQNPHPSFLELSDVNEPRTPSPTFEIKPKLTFS